MAFPIDSPLPVFYDRNGDVLDAGFIYIGTANTNPETNPIAVYWDAAQTIPAPQPLRTVRGFIARNGAPSNIYVATDYSIVSRDRNRQLVLNEPNSATIERTIAILGNPADGLGVDLVANADRSFATIAAMRAHPIPTPVSGRTYTATVMEHTASTGRGGGDFWWDAASALADDDGITINPTGNVSTGRWRRIYSGDVDLSWFNADPTAVAFSDVALASAIAAAGVNGVIRVSVGGTYKFQTQVFKAGSFDCFSIIGANEDGIRFDYSAVPGDSFFRIRGGSGQTVLSRFEGIEYAGASGKSAFKVEGQCGLRWIRCHFINNTAGTPAIWLYNDSANFTEFCVAEQCDFATTSPLAMKYERAGGSSSDSFHGSGLLNCIGHNGTANLIEIGATCRVYNAPMTVDTFASSTSTIIQNNSTIPCTMFGTLGVETSGGTVTTFAQLAGGNAVNYVGEVVTLSSVRYGTLRQCDAAVISGSEFSNLIQLTRRPFANYFTTVTSPATIINVANLGPRLSSALVNVRFSASNYEYRYLLYAEHSGVGLAGSVTTLATGLVINTAGYGAPTFSINSSGDLIATNAGWPAATVSVSVTVTPMNGAFTSYA